MLAVHNSHYQELSRGIRILAGHLWPPIQQHTSPALHADNHNHKGKRFRAAAVSHARMANRLEWQYGPYIEQIAGRITGICGRGWQDKPEVLDLWQQLAQTVTCFSEHPTKKVATLIVSADNRLEAFSANRVPPGIRKRGRHYVVGERKNYIVCSERMAIAGLFDLKLRQATIKRTSPPEDSQSPILRDIVDFCDAIPAAARQARMEERFLLSTTTPCDTCVNTIVALRPAAVFTNSHKGHDFTRNVSFDGKQKAFAAQGIPLIDLAPKG